MSMSIGGIIASALAQGAGAGMQSMAKSIDEEQKAALQARRDAAISKLAQETHKVNAQSSADIELAQAPLKARQANELSNELAPDANKREVSKQEALLPGETEKARALAKVKEETEVKVVPRESRLVKDGVVIIDGVERKLTPEEVELLKERTRESQARQDELKARAGKEDRAGGPKEDKEKPEKQLDWKADEQRRGWAQDKTTGYWKRVIKGKAAEAGSSGVFGFGKTEGKPAEEDTVAYFAPDGKTVVPFETVEAARRTASGNKPAASASAKSSPAKGYPEGTVLNGPNGKKFIVRGGQPVPL